MIEREKTFLVKSLPKDLHTAPSKEIIDVYFPKTKVHPTLRLRKNGDRFELTKKEPVTKGDASVQKEQTIILTEEEFALFNTLEGKRVHKIRYAYPYKDTIAEFDVFQGPLKGLAVVDFEFESEEEKERFIAPDFCFVDITQEDFIAGGMLCGKRYEDIEEELARFDYERLE
ncbi:MAG: hypothetical protein ACMXYK_03415 [Candidatus Woesearchaeota archaeon]